MRPDRIIVGEVRQAECLDLLIALNSGFPGMCSLHANSAREAIVKLCTLPLLAGENVSTGFVRADGGELRRHRRAPQQGRRRAPPGARDRRGAGPGRGRRRRGRRPVRHARASGWCARTATRRIRSASSRPASTCRRCWRTTERLCSGRAARTAARTRLPADLAVRRPAPRRARVRGGAPARADPRDAGRRPGSRASRPRSWSAPAPRLALVVFVVVLGTSQVPVIAVLFAGFAAAGALAARAATAGAAQRRAARGVAGGGRQPGQRRARRAVAARGAQPARRPRTGAAALGRSAASARTTGRRAASPRASTR